MIRVRKQKEKIDVTDKVLRVSTFSQEEVSDFDVVRIEDSLRNEISLIKHRAKDIAKSVEKKIIQLGITDITTSLIRALIDVELMERGLLGKAKLHDGVRISLSEIEAVIQNKAKENSNTPLSPESINLVLSEMVQKEYALQRVFSPDVAEAHMAGDVHLHDLGFITRPYCGSHSPEYVKKHGLKLPSVTCVSVPPRHPEVFVTQLLTFANFMQGLFAGAIGFDAVNLFFAPMIVGMNDKEVKQIAQMLVYGFSQLAGARGGQVAFTDFNLFTHVPHHYLDVPAIGNGGEYTGKFYQDYEEEAQQFLSALLDVYYDGDKNGTPFFFPKPNLHIDKESFNEKNIWLLEKAAQCVSKNGSIYFLFDRGELPSLAQCCRLTLELTTEDRKLLAKPEDVRFVGVQNVTVNLPRCAYKANYKDKALFNEIHDAMKIAVKAHKQKTEYIKKLIEQKDGPLSFFANGMDGEPYIYFDRSSYLIGVLGLNEMVKHHCGAELHESQEAYDFGLEIIKFMKECCDEFKKSEDMKFVLEETPAESTSYRFARLDMAHFQDCAKMVVKGNPETGDIYYTNSIHFAYDADIDIIERIKKQSVFHPFITAGAIVHGWMGDKMPDAKSILDLIKKIHSKTMCKQIVFSPEFSLCTDCGKLHMGLIDDCPDCGGKKLEWITRVTGYFSKVGTWSRGKMAELRDRKKYSIGG